MKESYEFPFGLLKLYALGGPRERRKMRFRDLLDFVRIQGVFVIGIFYAVIVPSGDPVRILFAGRDMKRMRFP